MVLSTRYMTVTVDPNLTRNRFFGVLEAVPKGFRHSPRPVAWGVKLAPVGQPFAMPLFVSAPKNNFRLTACARFLALVAVLSG